MFSPQGRGPTTSGFSLIKFNKLKPKVAGPRPRAPAVAFWGFIAPALRAPKVRGAVQKKDLITVRPFDHALGLTNYGFII